MSFAEVLKETVDKVDGAVSAMIIGSDGITVQEYLTEKLIDLTELSAEASAMIKDINLAALNLGIGEAREFSIISDKCGIIMRKITSDYYLALIIHPDGNYGKGRFVLKTAVPKLAGEF
ncbi:MAG: roadblock/LC7 domain-containing protein [Nitrospirae bacterium]|jgi:predicted regulator of Ras-like GTPase activity (Roadblock/LC7/MglB family)|nr:roadblock/LC7 domain-containing protein [Nitrospirota bacterium]